MGFLDSLSQSTQAVADKLRNASDSASLSSRIAKEQEALAAYFAELGKTYYNNHKDAPESDVEEICKYIEQTLTNISLLEAEKDKVNKIARCPQCNAELPMGSRFCTSCGYKFPTEAPAAPPTNTTVAKSAFCSNCGAPTTPGSAFCSNCGSKV